MEETTTTNSHPHQLIKTSDSEGISLNKWKITVTKKTILNSEELEE